MELTNEIWILLEEDQGFEPWEVRGTSVDFKSTALNHYANLPDLTYFELLDLTSKLVIS